MGMYIHAVLACDSVSVVSIADKGHVDPDQRCPVCSEDLPSDDRRQAEDTRERGRRKVELAHDFRYKKLVMSKHKHTHQGSIPSDDS